MPKISDRYEHLLSRRQIAENGCWLFTGCATRNGYGQLTLGGGKREYAHRLSWTRNFGPIPDGQIVHHMCETPLCFNPDHLKLVTPEDHGREHRSDVCVTCGANDWYVKPNPPYKRVCQVCRARLQRIRRAARRGKH